MVAKIEKLTQRSQLVRFLLTLRQSQDAPEHLFYLISAPLS